MTLSRRAPPLPELIYTSAIPLTPGTRIGPYEVLSALGAGGMGEVYRARDTKLNREVAIKVLLPSVANDPDRLARFSREAQVLASLNHPNIAAIYGIEDAAIVMELVEGEDLAQRIARGPIPLADALAIARQIVEALEAAHEQGIIHRDLKPANIKVRSDGTVKVLDFGLAKAVDVVPGGRDFSPADHLANSPTLSIHATEAGLILGTAAYMSPEQAAGKAVDKRTDLWAFGIVLMEMLTGRQVFKGETVSHLIAAVLKDEPDWTSLPVDTPPPIRRLLRRCLEKDRKLRLPDAAVARLEIDDALKPAGGDDGVSQWRMRPWAALGSFVAGGLIIGAAVWVMRNPGAIPAAPVVRFAIHDTDQVIVSREVGDMALSPDGRTLAFVGYGEGGARIWIRALDAMDARPLSGTEGAASLRWSPDSQSLAFKSFGLHIKKVAIAGGSPQVVAPIRARASQGRTLAWARDGSILFIENGSVWKVNSGGGTPTVQIPPPPGDNYASLELLPGDRHFLIAVQSPDPAQAGTFVAALDGGTPKRILAFPTMAGYAMGRLLFVRDRVLYAQGFDLPRLLLEGDPVPLAESVGGVFSASEHGAVVHLPLDSSDRADVAYLSWMDRGGRLIRRIDQAAGALAPVLSPDGRRLGMALRGDIWVLDLARSVLSKVASGGVGVGPTWLPDSQRLMFHRSLAGKDVLIETLAGSGKETTVRDDGDHTHATDISVDGRYLAYEGGAGGNDVWVMPLTGDRTARAVVEGPSIETQGVFSPDGRWLAYTSDTSGKFEVYVQGFPEPGARIQVSPEGGSSARWRRDGKELYYLAPDGTLMAVPIGSGDPIEFGKPAALFQFYSSRRGIPAQKATYDVTPDGQQFIVSAVPRRNDPSIQVLLNWPALMAAKAGH